MKSSWKRLTETSTLRYNFIFLASLFTVDFHFVFDIDCIKALMVPKALSAGKSSLGPTKAENQAMSSRKSMVQDLGMLSKAAIRARTELCPW